MHLLALRVQLFFDLPTGFQSLGVLLAVFP